MKKEAFNNLFITVAYVSISAFCWYFANDLTGHYTYLMFIAPISMILYALENTSIATFLWSSIAYFIGRLSWFSYLNAVITLVPTIVLTLLLSLIFALILVLTRKTVFRTNAWYSIFAFPVYFTIFEFLLLKFSPDGTAASIAYSQSNFLTLIQTVSITGLLGITFLLTLIPSALSIGWYFREEKKKVQYILGFTGFISVIVLLFGIMRLNTSFDKETIKVGLSVLDESFHDITKNPNFQKEQLTTRNYVTEIEKLAKQGAKLVVLPERAINITNESEKLLLPMLCEVARKNHVFIIAGYTNYRTDTPHNSDLVINTDGNIVLNYDKTYLVKVLENQFTKGNTIGLFNFNNIETGTAICKDLDFPDFIQKYKNITFLSVPAWDFGVDGWLHSRMAVMRGVENGFSEIRTARQGKLTISDSYGRITSEADCSDKKGIAILGNLSLEKSKTFYSKFGEWFGLLNLVVGVLFAFLIIKNKNK